MDLVAIDVISKIFSIYSLFLIVFGTVANTMGVIVCLRKRLRNNPTYIFMAFILVADIVCLYEQNLDNFHRPFNDGYGLVALSDLWCKMMPFIQFFSFNSSSWLLTIMTIERYLATSVKNWRAKRFLRMHAIIVSVITYLIAFSISFPIVFEGELNTIPADNSSNVTSIESIRPRCRYTNSKFFNIALTILTYTYSVIPFGIMLVFNCLLIKKALMEKKLICRTNEHLRSRRYELSISVLIISFSFILFTLPNLIVINFTVNLLGRDVIATFVTLITGSIGFTHHTTNFIVLLAYNKQFSREFKCILKRNKRRVANIDGENIELNIVVVNRTNIILVHDRDLSV